MGPSNKRNIRLKYICIQHEYYRINVDTRRKNYFTRSTWAKFIEKALDMRLGMLDTRCKVF